MPDALFAGLDPALIAIIAVTALVAGAVRGFTGFGAGLVFVPVVSALLEPRLAAPAFLVMDCVLTVPLVVGAVPRCQIRTVLPAAVGALAAVPFGAAILAVGDPLTLRWAISLLTLSLLALMVSGWRYHGAPRPIASVGVGGVAGMLSGIAQIPGPPIVAWWMAGPAPAATIRANLIVFFALLTIGSLSAYWFGGLFTLRTIGLVLVAGPTYAISIWLGAHAFGRATDRGFRFTAYGIIALAGLTSLPVLDPLLR